MAPRCSTEGTLLGFSILPSAACRVNENLSVSASLNAMYGKFESKVAVNNIIRSDGILKLDDNAWGFGANVGLLYEVNPGTRFGITYNSPLKLNFNAQPQWNDLGPGIRLLLASRGPSLSRGPPTERYAANGDVVIPAASRPMITRLAMRTDRRTNVNEDRLPSPLLHTKERVELVNFRSDLVSGFQRHDDKVRAPLVRLPRSGASHSTRWS